MRHPRVRFTVRRMMVAVAVVALLIVCGITWGRQRAYSRLASSYAARQVSLDEQVADWHERERIRKLEGRPLDCGLDGPHYRRMERIAAWTALMRRKYEYGASRPWLPVEPDPPEPE